MIAIILVWSATLFCVAVVAYVFLVSRMLWRNSPRKAKPEITDPWRDIR